MAAIAVLTLLSVGLAPPTAPAQPAQRDPAKPVKAERYEIDIRFEPEKGWLAAKATVTLRAVERVESIEFELNPRLAIKEITDAAGRRLEFNRSGRIGSPRLLVRLAEPARAGDEVKLTWVYEGAPRLGGLDYISKDGILLRDEARWYPAVDLAAFTQCDIRITLPRDWFLLTSGEFIEKKGPTDTYAYRWKTTEAVSSRSLVGFSGEFGRDGFVIRMPQAVQPAGGNRSYQFFGMLVATDSFGLRLPLNEPFTYFDKLLGEPKGRLFRVVQAFPGSRGAFGYSAPGFLVVSADVVTNAHHRDFLPEFLPHEIAHQWFPIEVTLERPEDGWLAESLAEYLAWRYLLEKQPEAARVMVVRAMRDALAGTRNDGTLPPLGQGLRMFALYDWEVTYPALYQRGMLVWRTLEAVIGRQRVDAALREYYQRHRGGPASVADFRKLCEEISGRDLKWFFDYYLEGTEIPEIEIRRVPGAAPNEYTGEIHVKNVPPEFTTRVEMKLHTSEGVVEHSVATRGEVTPFTVNVRGAVTRVETDPDLRILRWTEAARAYRAQRQLMANASDAEEAGDLPEAMVQLNLALAVDPGNAARNSQVIDFQTGRIHYRRGMWTQASKSFEQALNAHALDPGADAFYRAWSHVFLARIARRQGRVTAARQLASKGLALPAYALGSRVRWLGEEREQSAQEALQSLARATAPSKRN